MVEMASTSTSMLPPLSRKSKNAEISARRTGISRVVLDNASRSDRGEATTATATATAQMMRLATVRAGASRGVRFVSAHVCRSSPYASRGGKLFPKHKTATLPSRDQLRLRCAGTTEAEAEATPAVDLTEDQVELYRVDIRAGKILSVQEHEEADSLYIEQIDVGEEEPRTIVSGLRPYMPASSLEGKMCVVLANLKPRNMRGVKSHGMLLCASDKETEGEEKVELLVPKEGTQVGERLCFGEFVSAEALPAPDGPNKIQKKKVWEKLQPDLRTNEEGGAAWKDLPMVSSAGQVGCDTLKNSNIS